MKIKVSSEPSQKYQKFSVSFEEDFTYTTIKELHERIKFLQELANIKALEGLKVLVEVSG